MLPASRVSTYVRKEGARCVPFKILNDQVDSFSALAQTTGVDVNVRGHGQEMTTVYVCEKSGDVETLKRFVGEAFTVFVANQIDDPKVKRSAA